MLIVSPTGSGKTALTVEMLRTAAAKGFNSWFCVHRVELIRQSIGAFASVGVAHGVVAAGFLPASRQQIQVCGIQTLARRWQNMTPPKLIVYDEAHHIAAKSWAAIRKAFPDAFHIGLTATPERTDGKGLRPFFQEMILGPSVSWLIENKFLSQYRIFVPPGIDTSGLRRTMGDFDKHDLAERADKPTITGSAVLEYKKNAAGKRFIVRGVSIEHSKHIASEFNMAGIPVRHVDGDTPVEEREAAMKAFMRGDLLGLSNCDLFCEGVDVPALECVIDLRPTQSLVLALQFWGRALRVFPGKSRAIILDLAGNLERHLLPDMERQWSLDGGAGKANAGGGGSVRVCPRCHAAAFAGKPACEACGYVYQGKPREVEQVDGELVEVDAEKMRLEMKRQQGMAWSFEELVAIGVKRGYRNAAGWAKIIWNYRQLKKLQQGRPR